MTIKKVAYLPMGFVLLSMLFGNSIFCSQRLVDHLNLTQEKLRQDQGEIVSYINYIAGWICVGLKTPPSIAWAFSGIERNVYDSMPKVFINEISNKKNKIDYQKIDTFFEEMSFDEKALKYIKEQIEEFEKQSQRPVHNNTVGKISYRKLVENLDISDNHKEILKSDPSQMNLFLEKNIVKKNEYIRFNMLNLTAQHYLQKHNIIKQ